MQENWNLKNSVVRRTRDCSAEKNSLELLNQKVKICDQQNDDYF